MKVLYTCHQYFPHHIGGTEIYTRGLSRRMHQASNAVEVFTAFESGQAEPNKYKLLSGSYESIPLTELHYNLSVTEFPARDEYFNPKIGEIFKSILQNYRPDLVHVIHSMRLSVAIMKACLDLDVPYIVSLCDFWYLCPRHSLLDIDSRLCSGPDKLDKCLRCVRSLHGFAKENSPGKAADVDAVNKRAQTIRQYLLGAKKILALSQFQKNVFVVNGYPESKIDVMTHGVEPDDFASEHPRLNELSNKAGTIKIGFIGHLVEHKGAHILLKALQELNSPKVFCDIWGPLRDDPYVSKIADLAISQRGVRLLGELDPARLSAVLQSFDVLAMPALWYENQPLIVKAALAMGLPVLSSDIGSLSEMIQPGRNGWLLPAGDVSAWKNAIDRLLMEGVARLEPTPIKDMNAHFLEIKSLYEEVLAAAKTTNLAGDRV